MMRLTHRDGAILGSLLVAKYIIPNSNITIPYTIILSAGSILGGYICDIDEPKSYISRKLYILLWPFYIARTCINIIAKLPSPFKRNLVYVCKVLRHKGITHTPFVWLIIGFIYATSTKTTLETFLVAYWSKYNIVAQFMAIHDRFLFGFLIGITTHIILDIISEGVMLLFPMSLRLIKLKLIHTGSCLEIILRIIIIITNLILFKDIFSNI